MFLCDNDVMRIEEEVFRKSHPVANKLKAYGFKNEGDHYVFRKTIMDGSFDAEIRIDEKGRTEGKSL